jgi:hypothetical protein
VRVLTESTRAEYSESGASTTPAWSQSYVYLGDRLLSTLTPNAGAEAIQYHHPDRLGTRVVSDPGGTSFELVTLPFGTAYDSPQGRFTQVGSHRHGQFDARTSSDSIFMLM